MFFDRMHVSDGNILALMDGEASRWRAKRWKRHISGCRRCQARMFALRAYSDEVSDLYDRIPAQGSLTTNDFKALLKDRVNKQAVRWGAGLPEQWTVRPVRVGFTAICLGASVTLLSYYRFPSRDITKPSSEPRLLLVPASGLTPGKTRPVTLSDICGGRYGKNAEVLAAVRKQVFAKYGLQGAKASDYEVDYLITPALGGVDDVRNLWPQPYHSRLWNAHTKDALEDRLQQMVCSGEVDLRTAQRDIARNWIEAYRKYFHRDGPGDQGHQTSEAPSHF